MNWLHSPILAMDTETTGTNVESDRIVTIAIGRSTGPGDWNLIEDSLINPGVPIQADATKVHGITDEDAAKGSPPRDVLESVHEIFLCVRYPACWRRAARLIAGTSFCAEHARMEGVR